MLKVQLTRDLRKNLLKGHPWVYREAVQPKKTINEATICQLLDKKGKGLAWGIYSPEGPLAVRRLSLQSKPPNSAFYEKRLRDAWSLRQPLMAQKTNAFRLVNGEGDFLPGFVCDLYDKLAVMQFDGEFCYQFWDQEFLAQWILENTPAQTVYCKPRRSDEREGQFFGEPPAGETVEILENGVRFFVDFVNGQKTGFFLDQRDNRKYLGQLCEGKKVLNLFSYTGGFSVYAGLGKATDVTSVDLSAPALEFADKSWELNGLDPQKHSVQAVDVFEFLENATDEYQVVMVDPPSMTHSEKTKDQAVKSYVDIFAKAARLVEPGQHLVVSSCSSHISFDDFFEIIEQALSKARLRGQILRVSGQGIDHPFPHASKELQYLKFVDLRIQS